MPETPKNVSKLVDGVSLAQLVHVMRNTRKRIVCMNPIEHSFNVIHDMPHPLFCFSVIEGFVKDLPVLYTIFQNPYLWCKFWVRWTQWWDSYTSTLRQVIPMLVAFLQFEKWILTSQIMLVFSIIWIQYLFQNKNTLCPCLLHFFGSLSTCLTQEGQKVFLCFSSPLMPASNGCIIHFVPLFSIFLPPC